MRMLGGFSPATVFLKMKTGGDFTFFFPDMKKLEGISPAGLKLTCLVFLTCSRSSRGCSFVWISCVFFCFFVLVWKRHGSGWREASFTMFPSMI